MASLGFRDVAEILRSAIESGKLQPGTVMPSEAELSTEYQVSRTTVRRALSMLQGESLVEVVPGRGRIVRSSSGSARRGGESPASFIARSMREQREGGILTDFLLTIPVVVERFGVSEATARSALVILSREGLLTMAPGIGWHWKNDNRAISKTDEVAAELRRSIESGEWPDDTRIPGEMLLAARYGVGRVTVRRAISQLAAEGLLATKAGIGTIVVGRA